MKFALSTSKIVIGTCVAVVTLLVLNPTLWLMYGSFSTAPLGEVGTFTFKNYVDVFRSAETGRVFANSLIFAAGSTLIALALALPLAWIVVRTNTPFRSFFEVTALLPYMIHGIVLTMGWIYLASPKIGIINNFLSNLPGVTGPIFDIYTLGGMIWIAGLINTPIAFLIIAAALSLQDAALEEAARMSRANFLGVFRRITLPLIRPAILAAAVLNFVRVIESFEIPAFVGLPGRVQVLTTQIYTEFHYLPPSHGTGTSYAMLLLVTAIVLVYLYRRMTKRAESFATVTGKGYRPTIIDLGRWRYVTFAYAVILLSLAAVLPLIVVVLSSMAPLHRLTGIQDFSLKPFMDVINSPIAVRAFSNSVLLAVGGATLTMLLTALIAYIIARTKSRASGVLDGLSFLPLAFPGIVIAVGLLWAYISFPIRVYGTLWILLIAYMTRFLPYGLRAAHVNVLQINKELEEAGRIHGANWLRVFRHIVLPIIRPGLVAAWIFLAITYLGELSASILLFTTRTEVLAVMIYEYYEINLWSELSAVGVIMTVITVALALTALKLGKARMVL